MSTEVSLNDESAILGAIADVRRDLDDKCFVICGHHDGNPNVIELRATGSDTAEIASYLDETEALYCLARYESVIDMSKVVKFVYIHWMGEKVSFVKKGRLGVVHGSIYQYFNPHHLLIETSSLEDLDRDKIMGSLEESMGTKNKVLENSELSNRQMRGFTQTSLPKKDDRPHFNVSAVASKGQAIEILPEVYDSVAKVRSDTDPETWTVAGYKDSSPKGPMVTVGVGNGDISELVECLDDSQAMYGLYRLQLTNADDISTTKFAYVQWVGTKLKPMSKAKIATHKGAVEEIFYPAHTKVYATEPSEISESGILAVIKQQSS